MPLNDLFQIVATCHTWGRTHHFDATINPLSPHSCTASRRAATISASTMTAEAIRGQSLRRSAL